MLPLSEEAFLHEHGKGSCLCGVATGGGAEGAKDAEDLGGEGLAEAM